MRARIVSTLVLGALWLIVTGCGTPSWRLPPRIIDDPITVPRRMVAVQAGAHTWRDARGQAGWDILPEVRYGLTNRLELHAIAELRYAVLDDAPPSSASTGPTEAPAPLSMALTVGLRTFGWTPTDGDLFYMPSAFVEVAKRIGHNLRLYSYLGSRVRLGALPRRNWLFAGVFLDVAPADRWLLRLRMFDTLRFQGLGPSRAWQWHEIAFGPELHMRPWHWVTLQLGAAVGAENYAPAASTASAPDSAPTGALAERRQPSLGAHGALVFHW